MSEDALFRLSLAILLGVITALRVYYHHFACKTRGKVELKEGWINLTFRVFAGVACLGSVAIYLVEPSWLAWSFLDLPSWLRWLGVALASSAVPLLLWVHQALGANFNTTLHLRQEHTLITSGPYRWVRHPMYTVITLLLISFFLISASWFIGLLWLSLFAVILIVRVPREEAVMREEFGDAYRDYMKRTGRFFPRLAGKELPSTLPAQTPSDSLPQIGSPTDPPRSLVRDQSRCSPS
jgi:protein-S-isoprenylcysteine O-methyltransferase Ste14